jgi:hypothetical protein
MGVKIYVMKLGSPCVQSEPKVVGRAEQLSLHGVDA